MAFIRCRQSNRAKSYQVVESYREGGKVKQRVLANLGRFPTADEALLHARGQVERWERWQTRYDNHNLAWQRKRAATRNRVSKWLAKARNDAERLEAVVSETSRHPDVSDTTGRGNPRRSVVRLSVSHNDPRITSDRLSGLQAAMFTCRQRRPGWRNSHHPPQRRRERTGQNTTTLKTILEKRLPGTPGCEVS